MKFRTTLVMAMVLGIVAAPVIFGAGAAVQAGADARIVFYVA